MNSARLDESLPSPEPLHQLAQQKVRLALAALGKEVPAPEAPPQTTRALAAAEPEVSQEPDLDRVLQQALDRMHEQLGDVCALDRDGHELSWRELAEVVIGPLGARSRDADTAAALLEAVTPDGGASTDTIYADLVAEQRGGHAISREHAPLGNGGQRYVFTSGEHAG